MCLVKLFDMTNEEKFIKEHKFTYSPYIPRKGEVFIVNGNLYRVLNICTSYHNSNDIECCIEIALKEYDNLDFSNEWWE